MSKHELRILGENIRLLRTTHHLTQKEMAAICGIGVGSLRQIERGILPPQADVRLLITLSSRFNMSAADLFLPPNETDRSAR